MKLLKSERLNALLFIENGAPVIFGCSGTTLTFTERTFFKEVQPQGFILFSRNIQDKDQLKNLIQDLKSTVHHPMPLILIDQEGGRVARLKEPHWFHPPAVAKLVTNNMEESKDNIYSSYRRMGQDLKEVGITVNCAPVLDLYVKGADPIMGDRTLSADPYVVAELGAVAINALQAEGIFPMMKHIPGHGAALCDSHEALPVVNLPYDELLTHFLPFKENASCPMAMTAHIVYSEIDPKNPATLSSVVIDEIIRGEIGFKGLLFSDDIGMKALSGTFAQRAQQALEAGCDTVLHCSGLMHEMIEVMNGINYFSFPQTQRVG